MSSAMPLKKQFGKKEPLWYWDTWFFRKVLSIWFILIRCHGHWLEAAKQRWEAWRCTDVNNFRFILSMYASTSGDQLWAPSKKMAWLTCCLTCCLTPPCTTVAPHTVGQLVASKFFISGGLWSPGSLWWKSHSELPMKTHPFWSGFKPKEKQPEQNRHQVDYRDFLWGGGYFGFCEDGLAIPQAWAGWHWRQNGAVCHGIFQVAPSGDVVRHQRKSALPVSHEGGQVDFATCLPQCIWAPYGSCGFQVQFQTHAQLPVGMTGQCGGCSSQVHEEFEKARCSWSVEFGGFSQCPQFQTMWTVRRHVQQFLVIFFRPLISFVRAPRRRNATSYQLWKNVSCTSPVVGFSQDGSLTTFLMSEPQAQRFFWEADPSRIDFLSFGWPAFLPETQVKEAAFIQDFHEFRLTIRGLVWKMACRISHGLSFSECNKKL